MIASLGPLPAGNKSVAKYRQIGEHLRNLINRGELRPGMRLPGMIALAKQWKTNYFTVSSAFIPLANEGLIKRTPRGTFVEGCSSKITSVAIYYGCNPWDEPESTYFQQAYRELQLELKRRGIHCHLFMDSRVPERQFSPLSDLTRAIERREIQGVIGLMLNAKDVPWLEKLPVPISILSTLGNRTGLESTEALALDRLAADGCKTVGMIHPSGADIYPRFEEMVKERGMKTKEVWLRKRSGSGTFPGGEQFGYQEFKKLWSLKDRPRGLFIHADWVCRGAITAILQLGVRVPQNLRLVLYRNAGLDYICPWPVPIVVSDVRKTATALVRHLLRDPSKAADKTVSSPSAKLVG